MSSWKTLVFTLLVIGLLLPTAPAAYAGEDTLSTIIPKIINAYGGKAAIENAKTLYAKGTINAFVRGEKGSYVRYFKRDGKLRVETVYTTTSELRVLNGKRGWRNMNNLPLTESEGPPLRAMLYQYKETDIPYGLMKEQYLLRYEGKKKLKDTAVEVLDLEDADGIPIKIYVDMKSYRILRTEGYFLMGGTMTSLASEYSDFKKVGGVLLPYTITNYAANQMISKTAIKQYKVNMDMPEKLFRP